MELRNWCLKHLNVEKLFVQFKKVFEIKTFNFCQGHFEILKLNSYDDVVSQSVFFSEILGLLLVELLA